MIKIFAIFTIVYALCLTTRCNGQKDGFAFSVDNTPVYYKTFGAGKPLLIINGGPGMNSAGFENLAIELSRNNKTIIYDQRGTGKSVLKSLDTSTITMKLMADDIECIRKQLKIERWSILGHSFGGMLASYYAAEYPSHIEKIILSSSGGIDLSLLNYVQASINSKLNKTELDSVNYWTQKINNGDTSYYAKLARGQILALAYVIDKKFIPVIAKRLTQGNTTINQLIWNDLQKINFNCSEKLSTFNKPALIILGKEDIIKPETAEKEHLAFKNSKIIFLEHSIHYGWLDNKEVFFNEINLFLTSD